MTDISNVITSRKPTQLEGLAINGQLTLNKLINTVEEIFTTLATFSSSENTEDIRQKVTESQNKYKNVSDELNNIIGQIDVIWTKKKEETSTENNMELSEPKKDPEIKGLIETRDSLLQESETQKNHLKELLDQTYELQFLIQTLLASCEQQEVVLPDS
ncbi:14283_t:CDS:2 [Cetraspora pellucida]|uniref:14283_t:CDS:1 n=1 Tax=Cetraspora pellucida TaxID=1433469 RepID=A0A9N8VA77_9GLOM|nr:14283_t:CDS:2 [Cetraspora pellucida]